MIRKVQFESQERRIKQVLAALKENGINSIEEANEICENAGVDPYQMCEDTQRICFENAKWAYVCGAAIAIKKGVKTAADAAEAIGIGLQSFCIPGSVADDRKVGLGHGNLAARLLREETTRFVRTLCVLSSTVWAKTLHRLSAASMALHTLRPTSTTIQAS